MTKTPFEVGKTYPTRRGNTFTVLSIIDESEALSKFVLVGVKRGLLYAYPASYRADGTGMGDDLIPPAPPVVVSDTAMNAYFRARSDGLWRSVPDDRKTRRGLAAAFAVMLAETGR